MTPQEIKKFFPFTIQITEAHRQTAILRGGEHKLGNILLEENLPKELHEEIFWGLSIGNINGVKIKTEFKQFYKNKWHIVPLYLDKNFYGDEATFELR